ncbi:hypothetical protein JCM10908_007231 [Rhodotorula pacifica]|uniref:glycosyltransferase family 69 protein n=1 Tax=Rhodotorula pacifica TaxID=1495444 RepID=UPI0031759E37
MRYSLESQLSDAQDRIRDDTPLLPQHVEFQESKRAAVGAWSAVHSVSSGASDDDEPHPTRSHSVVVECPDATYAKRIRQHRRQHRLASLAYSSTLICFAVSCILAAGVLGWVAHFLYMRQQAYSTAVFSKPLIPQPEPVEERVESFGRRVARNASTSQGDADAGAWAVTDVEAELQRRFDALDVPARPDMSSLPCAALDGDADSSPLVKRYAPLRHIGPSNTRQGRTLLALNLYNSQDLLPSLSRTLLAVTDFLGPSTVFVSIFENGSTDQTTTMLAHLAAALTALGAEHTIVSDPRKTDWKAVDRIDQLAVYRNVAMEPMTANPDGNWDDVIFINDVYVCPTDILELVYQRKAQDADAACAMDWRRTKGWGARWRDGIKFYDNWVSRTLRGGMLRARTDVFAEFRDGIDELWDQPGEEYSRDRFRQGLPVPVYSCWNGMLSLTAAPFVSTSSSPRYESFPPSRTSSWNRPPPIRATRPARFRSALNHMGECAASECKTLAKDFWSRGYDRWLIVPTVRTTYDLGVYTHPQLLDLVSRYPPTQSTLSLSPSNASEPVDDAERIRWSDLTPPQEIICWAWVRGFHLDFEIIRASWERPWAYARSLISRARRR